MREELLVLHFAVTSNVNWIASVSFQHPDFWLPREPYEFEMSDPCAYEMKLHQFPDNQLGMDTFLENALCASRRWLCPLKFKCPTERAQLNRGSAWRICPSQSGGCSKAMLQNPQLQIIPAPGRFSFACFNDRWIRWQTLKLILHLLQKLLGYLDLALHKLQYCKLGIPHKISHWVIMRLATCIC